MRERVIDVSALAHPEPLEIMTEAIGTLERGEYIRMIHRLEPLPLYEILLRRGFVYRVFPQRGGGYHILIATQEDRVLLGALEG